MKDRVYVVYDNELEREVLVRAQNRAQAVRQVTEERFKVRPASAEDVLRVTDYGGENLFTEKQEAK